MKAINKKQKGFTLIELMIVVGIIGVLSAIAVPAYQSYLLKTEANTAVSIPRALLTNIDLYIQENGKFPTTAQMDKVGAASDMSAMGTIGFTPTADDSATGDVLFTIGSTASLKDKKVKFAKLDSGWKCTHDTGQTLKGCEQGTIN
ncbi:prepilin-type N-terminal cleavage/methylation domain-containing protein [Vibrio sp. YMD68]|uniref:type IV pilin protein n=1 Tax=Vibrio sp. YMD68 TaxID=3042300 RepID=UPI00249BFF9C|nr:prepilin-type N-terminal cleavage/methylation domain-containing protein [Vibrio sp. YMD68]WGV99886.1 prepilin-type N-terminal cleavage/methylation domain-containing protein [Vibrio sp. YMD68]